MEVLVSTMLLAMLTVAVSSLLLSMFGAAKAGQARHEISLEAKKLREHLKAYVTADTSVKDHAPGNPPWHLPGDLSCSGCWALSDGTHEASALLPESLRLKYKAAMSYTVTSEIFRGRQVRKVRIAVDWEAP